MKRSQYLVGDVASFRDWLAQRLQGQSVPFKLGLYQYASLPAAMIVSHVDAWDHALANPHPLVRLLTWLFLFASKMHFFARTDFRRNFCL